MSLLPSVARGFPGLVALVMALATSLGPSSYAPPAGVAAIARSVEPLGQAASARQKIKHVVIVMQENHSFDNYFGTYPGADGIPMAGGMPTACVPDPATNGCVRPYHNPSDREQGGPHSGAAAVTAINGGQMDGFIRLQDEERKAACAAGGTATACQRRGAPPDVMGYHDAREVPNYWAYAHEFVLQDRMFAPSASYTLPSHLFLVSGWSARCRTADPSTCRSTVHDPENSRRPDGAGASGSQPYAWTDLTYLLHRANVSWAYYVADGAQPECARDGTACSPKPHQSVFDAYVSPLPRFQTVHDNGQLSNVQSVNRFYEAAGQGKLPAVSWIVPDEAHSEHPPESIRAGQAYVTRLVNAVMRGPDWNSTAIFITWDEWGGFYDHVVPPQIDENGYGLRVPGLVISPYARAGYVDHQTLSFDAYLRFVEDVFLDGQRLDPRTTGRPDPRPTVRETAPELGNLMNDFDFDQPPRPPLVLNPDSPPGPPASDPSWRQPPGCRDGLAAKLAMAPPSSAPGSLDPALELAEEASAVRPAEPLLEVGGGQCRPDETRLSLGVGPSDDAVSRPPADLARRGAPARPA